VRRPGPLGPWYRGTQYKPAPLLGSGMPVPGYDPDDLDDALESLLDEAEIEASLETEDLTAYREGEADLADLLDPEEMEAVLERKEGGTE